MLMYKGLMFSQMNVYALRTWMYIIKLFELSNSKFIIYDLQGISCVF